MSQRSRQDEINQAEWNNDGNWRGPRWIGFYASSRDSRTFVPKRPRVLGFTLNFGHASARWLLAAIAAATVLASAGMFFLTQT